MEYMVSSSAGVPRVNTLEIIQGISHVAFRSEDEGFQPIVCETHLQPEIIRGEGVRKE